MHRALQCTWIRCACPLHAPMPHKRCLNLFPCWSAETGYVQAVLMLRRIRNGSPNLCLLARYPGSRLWCSRPAERQGIVATWIGGQTTASLAVRSCFALGAGNEEKQLWTNGWSELTFSLLSRDATISSVRKCNSRHACTNWQKSFLASIPTIDPRTCIFWPMQRSACAACAISYVSRE